MRIVEGAETDSADERGPKRREEGGTECDPRENDHPEADSLRPRGSSDTLPPPGSPVEKQIPRIRTRLEKAAVPNPPRIEFGRPHDREST